LSAMAPEIVRLRALPQLNALTLEGNPIALLNKYRSHTCAAVARAQRTHAHVLVLDGSELTSKEVSKARGLLHLYSQMEHTLSPMGMIGRGGGGDGGGGGGSGNSSSTRMTSSPESTATYLRSIGSKLLLGGSSNKRSHTNAPLFQGNNHRAALQQPVFIGKAYPEHVSVVGSGTENKKKSKHRKKRSTSKRRIVQFEEEEEEGSGNSSSNSSNRRRRRSTRKGRSKSALLAQVSESEEEHVAQAHNEGTQGEIASTQGKTDYSGTRNNTGEYKQVHTNDRNNNRKDGYGGGEEEEFDGEQEGNTDSNGPNDGLNGSNADDTDEWEKIRLYKERLVKKMAAYQQTLEKKRDQQGSTWLDSSSPIDHRKKRNVAASSATSMLDNHSTSPVNVPDTNGEAKNTTLTKEDIAKEEKQSDSHSGTMAQQEEQTEQEKKGEKEQEQQEPQEQEQQEQEPQEHEYRTNRNHPNTPPSIKTETSSPEPQQRRWYSSSPTTESDLVAYELDKQLESIEYIAEVFESTGSTNDDDDDDDRATSIILRICGAELSEIEMNTGRTINTRYFSRLLSVHTSRGTYGDTVLRAEFSLNIPGQTHINRQNNKPHHQDHQPTSEHVLYVLRQAGTLGQLLGVLNARIALNDFSKTGEAKQLKLQCLSCLLVFLLTTSASDQDHLVCPKCHLSNLRLSEKNLSKSVRHDIKNALKDLKEHAHLNQSAGTDSGGSTNGPHNNEEHRYGKYGRTRGASSASRDSRESRDDRDGKILTHFSRPLTVDWEYAQDQDQEPEPLEPPQSKPVSIKQTSGNRLMDSIRSNISQAFNFSDEDKSSNGNVSGSNSNNNDDMGHNSTSAGSTTNGTTATTSNTSNTSNTSQRAISTTTGGLLVDEHLEKYFREVTFAAGINDNTERFHAIFSTNIAPYATHISQVKNGTGHTERGAYVVTTDESVYFIACLPLGNGQTFSDLPEFSTIARYSLSDVCRVNIGFSGQRLRIDFVDASWVLITRDKTASYHFVQKVMPMIKTKRSASRRRGSLKIPQNPLALQAIRDGAMDSSTYGVAYTNEDQLTLENIHEHVIGQGNAGRSKDQAISTRIKLYVMLYERPNPASIRLVRHVPKNRLVPRTLIVTETALYLCDEDYAVEWPKGTPPFRVLRSALLEDCIEMVLKDDQRDLTLVVSTPVVGFVKTNKRWRLRCVNRQVKDQLVNLLKGVTPASVV
jgi:hypothetical protein